MTLLMRDQENQEIGEKRGFERGREQGIKQGREQGIKQGREQGREQGKVQERQKIILKMVKQGFSNEQIIMLCDISENEIERYRKQK